MKLREHTRKKAIDLLRSLEKDEHPNLEDVAEGVKLILTILLEKEGI